MSTATGEPDAPAPEVQVVPPGGATNAFADQFANVVQMISDLRREVERNSVGHRETLERFKEIQDIFSAIVGSAQDGGLDLAALKKYFVDVKNITNGLKTWQKRMEDSADLSENMLLDSLGRHRILVQDLISKEERRIQEMEKSVQGLIDTENGWVSRIDEDARASEELLVFVEDLKKQASDSYGSIEDTVQRVKTAFQQMKQTNAILGKNADKYNEMTVELQGLTAGVKEAQSLVDAQRAEMDRLIQRAGVDSEKSDALITTISNGIADAADWQMKLESLLTASEGVNGLLTDRYKDVEDLLKEWKGKVAELEAAVPDIGAASALDARIAALEAAAPAEPVAPDASVLAGLVARIEALETAGAPEPVPPAAQPPASTAVTDALAARIKALEDNPAPAAPYFSGSSGSKADLALQRSEQALLFSIFL